MVARGVPSFRRSFGSTHAQRGLVGIQDGFLFAALVGLHLTQLDDLPHDLGVVSKSTPTKV